MVKEPIYFPSSLLALETVQLTIQTEHYNPIDHGIQRRNPLVIPPIHKHDISYSVSLRHYCGEHAIRCHYHIVNESTIPQTVETLAQMAPPELCDICYGSLKEDVSRKPYVGIRITLRWPGYESMARRPSKPMPVQLPCEPLEFTNSSTSRLNLHSLGCGWLEQLSRPRPSQPLTEEDLIIRHERGPGRVPAEILRRAQRVQA